MVAQDNKDEEETVLYEVENLPLLASNTNNDEEEEKEEKEDISSPSQQENSRNMGDAGRAFVKAVLDRLPG